MAGLRIYSQLLFATQQQFQPTSNAEQHPPERAVRYGRGINNELLYLYSAAAPGSRNPEYRHNAKQSNVSRHPRNNNPKIQQTSEIISGLSDK